MTAAAAGDGLDLSLDAADDEGHRAELTVAAASPWFAGHFPGNPVLPAIAQLEIAARLHRVAGERGYLSGVHALRFSEPVRPGDRLVVHLGRCDEDGRGHLRLVRADDGVEVTSGTLIWGSPSADAVADAPEGGQAVEAAPAALPHAGAARLLEAVAVVGPRQVAGHGRVPPAHAAAHDGRAPALLAVELAAQAAAQVPLARERPAEGGGGDAHDASAAAAGAAPAAAGAPRLGYLVRLRDVRFARTEIDVDSPLVAHVDLAGRTGPLARFDFVVALPNGEPIAGGALTTWEIEEDG